MGPLMSFLAFYLDVMAFDSNTESIEEFLRGVNTFFFFLQLSSQTGGFRDGRATSFVARGGGYI